MQSLPTSPPRRWGAGFGSLWLATSGTDPQLRDRGDVSRFSLASGQLQAKTEVGRSAVELAVDSKTGIWVLDNKDTNVLRVDPDSNQVTARIPLGHFSCCLTSGHGRIWVTVQSP